MDDIVFEVDCALITVKEGADVDIGSFFFYPSDICAKCNLLVFLVGANPSADVQEESLEEGTKQVNNVAHSFRLQSTSFDKKSFLAYLKVIIPIYLVQAFGDVVSCDRDI